MENFVSSPSVKSDGSALFIHTANGGLWKVTISGDCISTSMRLGYGFACVYQPGNTNCNPAMADTIEKPVFDPVTGAVVRHTTVSLKNQEMAVAGGWNQPTTRQERDELHSAMRAMHAALHGEARTEMVMSSFKGSQQRYLSDEGKPLDLIPLQSAALAREIPREQLYSIVTPNTGYFRLGRDGKPGLTYDLQAGYGGIWPLSTPSLDDNRTRVVVSNWDAVSDSGVFSVDQGTGNYIWVSRRHACCSIPRFARVVPCNLSLNCLTC